ncbi:hypothetical protein GCM10023156_02780 [Novipirellula rosea]|uniref:Uncharacterized protein n=1 Tax=Novipirellula rosea TaxID=1031540 RepID=A0ABP8M4L9_9BACT
MAYGKDTRAGKFKENEFFKNLKFRTVNVSEVGGVTRSQNGSLLTAGCGDRRIG